MPETVICGITLRTASHTVGVQATTLSRGNIMRRKPLLRLTYSPKSRSYFWWIKAPRFTASQAYTKGCTVQSSA